MISGMGPFQGFHSLNPRVFTRRASLSFLGGAGSGREIRMGSARCGGGLMLRGVVFVLVLLGLVVVLLVAAPVAFAQSVPDAPTAVAVYSYESQKLEVRWSSSDAASTTSFKIQWKSGSEEFRLVPTALSRSSYPKGRLAVDFDH